ncbi:hydrocephalus-inducing protein-like [Cephus cinctus]|uniref:Hydrocephalus-inducing protein-like n=1 Tax=Cephus cinctus TaxID=211228 RepID=A0AAJ7RI88_CEPCN|nr:hydrocephalus-inducing protein-like [Cephus cinctus]
MKIYIIILSFRYARIFEIVKSVETLRCMDLIHYNICQAEVHEYICHRIYADEIVQLQSCTFDYKHSCFKLSPMSGEIWPQSSIDVLLVFDPDEIGEITSVAYLEIDGREDRIPINFTGICIGPTFSLNIVTADVGSIFLCSVHNYEIICVNKGFIPGTLIYRSKPTDFGGKIEVTPTCLKLQPEEHKSFNVAFSSKKTGEFVERIDFVVKESLETISMYIKGNVIRPTLHFDKDCLDFGVTAVGFTTKHEVCLHNLSLVPVTFQMNVLGDGSHSAISHHDFATSINKPKLEARPREFNIFPKRGVVMAHNFLRAKIAYTPNIVKYGQTAIQVDMWDSDSDPVMLPITFHGKVATLVVTPAEITIRFCFINFPYTRTITIGNTSDVEGYFYIIPQSLGVSTTMLYSLSIYQGYLKPLQSKNVTITIMTSVLGTQQTHLYLLTFGEENPTICCSLICNGQGPVVSVKPRHLDFGEVLLLRNVTLPLMLISDSPIPASYRVSINRKKSPWTIRPTSGELESNQQWKIL